MSTLDNIDSNLKITVKKTPHDFTVINLLGIEENDSELLGRSNQKFLDTIIGEYEKIHYLSRNSISFPDDYAGTIDF